MKKQIPLLLMIIIVIIAACGPADAPTVEQPEELSGQEIPPTPADSGGEESAASTVTSDGGYPAPTTEESDAYPASVSASEPEGAYPVPARLVDESKRFVFEIPLKAGQENVSGEGPQEIPIKIISVSYAGEVLGLGVTGSDRSFEVTISRPLEAQEVIGIQLGDENMREDFHDAPGTDIPMIGFILAQEIVEP